MQERKIWLKYKIKYYFFVNEDEITKINKAKNLLAINKTYNADMMGPTGRSSITNTLVVPFLPASHQFHASG